MERAFFVFLGRKVILGLAWDKKCIHIFTLSAQIAVYKALMSM